MKEIQTTLNHLAEAGLPLQITEFWSRSKGEKYEADEQTCQYIENAYTIGFGHPAMELFTYWGGDLIMPDGSFGPKLKTIENLVTKTWTTKEKLQTDDAGTFEVNAFFGTYSLRKDGKELKSFSFTKADGGKLMALTI